MKYVHYNEEGKILGIYHSAVYKTIPHPLIEIDDDLYNNIMNTYNKGKVYKVEDGVIVEYNIAISEISLDDIKKAKKDEIANDRYIAEYSGVEFNGVKILTDLKSQVAISGAVLQATMDPSYTCRWKSENGFIELNANLILAIGTAVREYIQNCFNKEADLIELINAATTEEEVEAINWDMEVL